MDALFGQVSNEDVVNFGSEGLLENGGDFFHYGVEYPSSIAGLDEFVIYDTCGRNIPVDIESVQSLIDALEFVRDAYETVNELVDQDCVISF